jgi:fructose-1,6-bisphosphatase I
MKRLDQVSKTILQNALRFTGRLRVVEAPRNENNDEEGPASHQPGVTIAYALDQYGTGKEGRKKRGVDEKWGRARRLAACFDPLDGSGNADAAICTGTVVCLSICVCSSNLDLCKLISLSNFDTIKFGVFDADAAFKGGESPDLTDEASLARAVLQPGNKLLAVSFDIKCTSLRLGCRLDYFIDFLIEFLCLSCIVCVGRLLFV